MSENKKQSPPSSSNFRHLIRFFPWFFPSRIYFVYIDTPEYKADHIFIKNKIAIKFDQEFQKEGDKYILVVCSCKKQDLEKFLMSMEELERNMLICGNTDYKECCKKMWETIEKAGEKRKNEKK